MKQPSRPMPQVQYDTLIMQGGVDQVTPLLMLKNGVLRDALNFEANILGGYSRIAGYERSDGHALPSSSSWTPIYIDILINIPAVGDTITGQTSGATAYVLAVGVNYIIAGAVSGIFQLNEQIKDATLVVGNNVTPYGVAISALQVVQYTALAANLQRLNISGVPGSGPVRGVIIYNDLVYAFRDNAGGTAEALYVQSPTGWTLVPFLYQVAFTAGTTQPAEGATLTKGGVTATIKRVVTTNALSTWLGGTAAGYLIISAPSGGNFSAGAATATGGTTMTLSGAQAQIALVPGGRYEYMIGNFGGQASTSRVYGCDGINNAFEFDGTIYVPILTGSTPDTPQHISVHKNFLMIGINASELFCAPGLPYDYSATDGAGVLAVGDNITNQLELPGAQTTAAMALTTQSTMFVLYGTGASTWNLVPLNVGSGALPYTGQNMEHTYFMDVRGVLDLQETLNYGNFNVNTITYPVNNLIQQERTKVVGSALNKIKSQYRIFFSDGYGIYITNVHGQYQWMNVTSYNMPVYFPNPVTCIASALLATGEEVTYFGSSNGMVYKLDSGTSFDGATISAYLTFAADQVGSPRILKRFRHAQLELQSNSYMQLGFGYTLGFNSTLILQPNITNYANFFSEPYWDKFVWDNFTWDGTTNNPSTEIEMNGTAENFAFVLTSNSDLYSQFSVNSALVHYTPRRGKR